MRRLVLSLLFSLGCCCLFAEPVTREEVHRQAVMACMRISTEDFSDKAYTITPILQEKDTCYYIVQFEPEGWALISADDRVQPLIGYSDKGLFQKEEAPEAALFWLEKRTKEIQVIKSLKGLKRDLNWEVKSLRSDTKSEAIAPLIKVNWNQTGVYAKYCPIDNKGKKTVVGCVAVAMAQMMSVYQYPKGPKGNAVYWMKSNAENAIYITLKNEKPYDWEKIMSGADNKDEVARLLYHCGVAVRMKYGTESSSASLDDVKAALIHNFSYKYNSLRFYVYRIHSEQLFSNKDNTYSFLEEEWYNIILAELKQGRPIIYGLGFLSHAVNVDGFDGINAFHLNYGWGGVSNGYYTLDEMRKVKKPTKDEGWGEYIDEDYYICMVTGCIPVGQSSTDIESVAQSLETPLQVVGSLLRLKSPEKGICRVYDLSGALLQTAPIVSGDNEIPLKTKGLCILSIDCNGKVASHKIHVKE
ncbi:MAG: hypothetical protein E7085_01395 [Parabacteroides distasonis]|nr:hypothetical protein [Parabacteroides distasonis]